MYLQEAFVKKGVGCAEMEQTGFEVGWMGWVWGLGCFQGNTFT